MALPFKSGGGGFLNGATGVIVGVSHEAKEWPPKKKGGEPYTTVSTELLIKQDGADAPVKQFLQSGFLHDEQNVDGSVIVSETAVITAECGSGRFLASLDEAGFDSTGLVESNLNDWSSVVGARVTFKREVDVEGTKQFGKRKGKTKDGKDAEYNRDFLLVAEYLGQVEVGKGSKGSKAKASAAAPKSAAARGGKANGAAKNAEVDAQVAQAESLLIDLLADGPIDRTSLSSKIVRYAAENPFSDDATEHRNTREALRKLIGSEDFLSREAGWTYSAKEKGQPVELA